jgi:hypothetical protein
VFAASAAPAARGFSQYLLFNHLLFFFMQPGFSAMFVLLSVIYAVSLAAKRD